MSLASGDIAIVLSTLAQVLQSELFVALFVLAVGTFFFAVFAIGVVASVYVLSYAWAGYENQFKDGEEEESGYDENEVIQTLIAFGDSVWAALAALAALTVGAAQSVGSAILNNVVLLFVFLFTFVIVVMWDTWHPNLLMAFGETYTCFVAPVLRTLFLPLANVALLIVSVPLAIVDAVREVWISITTETIIETLVCGTEEALSFIAGIVFTVVGQPGSTGSPPINGIVLALIEWFEGLRGPLLEVAPDFFGAGGLLGRTIAGLADFATCVCEPVAEIIIQPLFVPFNSTYFAQFVNATLNISPIPFFAPVLVTQGVLRPIVGTISNSVNFPGQSLEDIIVRPSLNSTFDTLETAVVNGGEFVDSYGQALFNITLNIVRESISTCPSVAPWTATSRCNNNTSNQGVCQSQRCIGTQAVGPLGCCKSNLPGNSNCFRAVSQIVCTRDFNGTFFAGEQCAQAPIGTCPQLFGCCASGLTGPSNALVATECRDDANSDECGGPATLHFGFRPCSAVSELTCLSQQPLGTVATVSFQCSQGAISCVNGAACACDQCLCRYKVNPTPTVENSTDRFAFGPCRDDTDDSEAICRLPVGITALPPVPALVTGALYLTVDALAIQPLKYGFNILFNIDTVFTTLDGYIFWNISDTIGQAARNGVIAIASIFDWLADLLREIGEILAEMESAALRPSQTNAIRELHTLSLKQRALLDQTFQTSADLIRFAFDLLATIFEVVGAQIRAVGIALISLVEFLVEQFVGAIYFSVRTAIEDGFPDVFAYAKIAFGDDAPPGIQYECFVPTVVANTTTRLFTAVVTDASAVTCNEKTEILEFCRFVFQRSFAEGLNNTNPAADPPAFISITNTNTNIPLAVQTCLFEVQNCAAGIVPVTFPPGFESSINQYVVLLEKFVDIARALDPLVVIWCEDCDDLGNFISGFVEPLVPIIMVPIDLFVHIGEMFTSGYIACLNVNGAAVAVNDFVSNFTNLFRAINVGVTGTPCVVGVGARDSRILCAIAQGIDALVNFFVQLVLIVWHVLQGLVRVIEGVYTPEDILSSFTFNTIEAPVQDASFAVFSILLQIIPRSVLCAGTVSSEVGCCLVTNVVFTDDPDTGVPVTPPGAPICVPSQGVAPGDCIETFEQWFPGLTGVETVVANRTCAQSGAICASAIGVSGIISIPLNYGCCKSVPPRFANRPPFLADSCIDEALNITQCQGVNPTNQFFQNQLCDTATFPDGERSAACPLTEGPVQDVVAAALGRIVADLILLIPKTGADIILALANLLVDSNIEAGIRAVFEAALQPLFEFFASAFRQIANIAGCAGSADLRDAFLAIANFIERELCLVLEIVVDLVLFLIFLVFGIIQALTEFSFDLLALAGEEFLKLLLAFAFAIFQPETVCGFQDFLCIIDNIVDPAPGTTNERVDFAINQCRAFFCCTENQDPEDGITGSCTLETGAITSCDQVNCETCVGQSTTSAFSARHFATERRKRSNNMFASAGRFASILEELSADVSSNETKQVTPNAAFCGAYLATYGIDKARAPNCTDTMAVQCLAASTERVTLRSLAREEWSRIQTAAVGVKEVVSDRWRAVRDEARAIKTHGAGVRSTRSLHDLIYVLHKVDHIPYSKRTIQQRRAHNAAARAVWNSHNIEIMSHTAVSFVHTALMIKDAFDANDHYTLRDWVVAHFSSGDVPQHLAGRVVSNPPLHHHFMAPTNVLTGSNKRAAAFAVAYAAAARQWNRVSSAMGRRFGAAVRRLAPTPERKAERQKLIDAGLLSAQTRLQGSRLLPTHQARFGAKSFDERLTNITLAAIGIFACNESTQSVCTGCLIVDNAIFAGEEAFEGLRTFYPDRETGFLSYVALHEQGFNNTLFDPIGTDTFTTVPKTTPWLFERLLDVNWFWQWDYSEFIDIVTQNGTSPTDFNLFVNQTEVQQRLRAEAVGRVDFDNQIFELFGRFIQGAVNFAERVVGGLNGAFSIDVFAAIFERYIKCDYLGALQCQSDLGIGLFDAIANVVLVAAVAILLVNMILPGMGILIFIVTLALSYLLIMWIAYGASPLCTLPSFVPFLFMFPLPGIPTCLPIDIYTLFAELLPQCFPIPISLIDPSALAEAASTLCAVCGTQPLLQNCADAAGFLNGFDNFFYITGTLLPPGFNQFIADTIASVAPDIAIVAALYTPEYIADLGDVGAVCNRLLLPNLITAAALVGIIGTLLLFIVSALALFGIAALWLYWALLLAANLMILQMDKGFVQGTSVEKLKLKGD